jgi:hypothetical protein
MTHITILLGKKLRILLATAISAPLKKNLEGKIEIIQTNIINVSIDTKWCFAHKT